MKHDATAIWRSKSKIDDDPIVESIPDTGYLLVSICDTAMQQADAIRYRCESASYQNTSPTEWILGLEISHFKNFTVSWNIFRQDIISDSEKPGDQPVQ